MAEELIELEKKWLNVLMAVDFPGKEFIERQLSEAYVSERVVHSTYASIYMGTTCPEKYPYNVNVPIGMDIIPPNGVPIAFNLYLNEEGFIHLLGIDSLSGDDIDYYNISFDNIKYYVSD
ncbi:hypothetical protein [Streptococcus ovis]|uniref:hypothetical protein n=1 Tax=Streptococcus ovis TaxID=82806 RepID=UPI000363690A|nr:hypothetical protein [Streptococcus ovis]